MQREYIYVGVKRCIPFMLFIQFHTNWDSQNMCDMNINPYFIIQCFITIIELFSPQVYYEGTVLIHDAVNDFLGLFYGVCRLVGRNGMEMLGSQVLF